ncbi:hypothetical protein [Paenarthrobacter sp. JL.01a]|uniref:hypothetical protein n=1 Tax=Paenarthrobacter sp. JL.01a TaxID=2979324 RepID=UPI0021C7B466|nr:hypothetical protein [Paenarthrobacter sp. JL.01a]UXM91112.1 hypothetical protein N5P29_17715 [Paenarthrobacter sp. JL.01a]
MDEPKGSEDCDKRRSHKAAIALDVGVSVVTVALVAFVCAFLWKTGGGSWFEQNLLNVIGYVGVAISLVGVLLAYLIFRRQSREGKSIDRYQRLVLKDLQKLLTGVDEKVTNLALRRASDSISDADAEQTTGADDLWAAFTPESDESSVYLSSPSGKRRRVYTAENVPLAVIGALVKKWDEEGLTGRWTLGTLRGAFRAEGKGNHPWYLVFVPPGGDTPIIWKVSRGPGGTDHAVPVKDRGQF